MTPVSAIVNIVVGETPGNSLWADFCAGKLTRFGLLQALSAQRAADLSERWADEQGPERLSSEAISKLSDEGRADYQHLVADASWAMVQNRTAVKRLEHLWVWAMAVTGDHDLGERIEAKVTVRYPDAVRRWRERRERHNAWMADGKPQGNPSAKRERPEAHLYADRDCPWCDWYDARDDDRKIAAEKTAVTARAGT